MNKTKLITLSLVIALVLMGTAFAWWTQSTTISNKITTGDLDVEIKKIKDAEIFFTKNNKSILNLLSIYDHYGAEVTKFQFPDKHTLDVEVQNMFPGSYTSYYFEVNNTGTVPIKISNVVLTDNGTNLPVGKINDLPITFNFVLKSKVGNIPLPTITTKVSGTYSNIAEKIKTALKDVVILPEDALLVGYIETDIENGFTITVPESWENDTENCTIAFSLNFDYTQANK